MAKKFEPVKIEKQSWIFVAAIAAVYKGLVKMVAFCVRMAAPL
jgi:hypothetical protein